MQNTLNKTLNRTHDGVVNINLKNQDEDIDAKQEKINDNQNIEENKNFQSLENLQICNEEAAKVPNQDLLMQITQAYNNAWIERQKNNESPIKSDDPQVKLAPEADNIFQNLDEASKHFIDFCKDFNETVRFPFKGNKKMISSSTNCWVLSTGGRLAWEQT